MSRVCPAIEVDEATFWTPSKVFAGQTVFVIGGGTSLIDFDWSLISDYPAIGVNDAYKLGPWIDYNIFGDICWHTDHREDLEHRLTVHVGITNLPCRNKKVKWMKRSLRKLGAKPYELGWFANTGMSAICLAVKLGAARVCLLGFDMKLSEESGMANWHENLINAPSAHSYLSFMTQGRHLKKELEAKHPEVEVLNCNPDSAWDAFPRVQLKEAM
jgi:hypothetical protein